MCAIAPYELLEHRADIGLRVRGATLGELFESASLGMFHIICEEPPPGWDESKKLYMEKADPADLIVEWLGELLYQFEVKKFWVTEPHIEIISEDGTYKLDAELKGIKISGVYTGTEIKAVTYHMLEVYGTDDGYETEIYFDL